MVNTYEQTMVENIQVNRYGSKMINLYSRITQFLSWPFIYVLIKPIFIIETSGTRNLKNIQSPFILVSNHVSFYDSFLFRLALGFFTPHLPLRFMAVKRFNWPFLNFLAYIGIIELVYLVFGVFTITPGLGVKQNLRKPIQILNSGGNIVIYAEGKISDNGIAPFKKGAAILSRITGTPIIPVSFRIIKPRTGFRKKILINIGEPLNFSPDHSIPQITARLHEEVNYLYNH